MERLIFQIEFNKSGSKSLAKALNRLGIRTAHFTHRGKRLVDIMRKNRARKRPLLSGLEKYQALTDFSGRDFFEELDSQYPGSKFIVLLRDVESWLESRARHVKRNQRIPWYHFDLQHVDKDGWRKMRDESLAKIESHFHGRSEDILFLNICDGEGWETLCPYVEKPVPEIAFPHKNQSSIFRLF